MVFFTNVAADQNQTLKHHSNIFVKVSLSKINLSYATPISYWDDEFRLGYGIGFSWEYFIKKTLSIDIGLELNQLGDKKSYEFMSPLVQFDSSSNQLITIDSMSVKGSKDKTLSYLSFPIHICCKLPKISTGLFVGYSFGYAISADQYFDNGTDGENYRSSGSILNIINKSNSQLQIGIDYEPKILKNRLMIGVMYSKGISNIAKIDFWYSKFKSNEIRIIIGFKLPE